MKKFTLIELLVVIAIIGILASMLLPSLQRAREAAKTAVCISNVKQINTALQGFFADYDDTFPNGWHFWDTWGSYLDPYLGGGEFTAPRDRTAPNMSPIWGACPNANTRENPWFRDADYAAIFNRYLKWPKGLGNISDTANSAIFTEGSHEIAANRALGNSWLKAGNGASEWHFNNVTGKGDWSPQLVRHDFKKRYVISNFDGSTVPIKWKFLTTFTADHGEWLNDF